MLDANGRAVCVNCGGNGAEHEARCRRARRVSLSLGYHDWRKVGEFESDDGAFESLYQCRYCPAEFRVPRYWGKEAVDKYASGKGRCER